MREKVMKKTVANRMDGLKHLKGISSLQEGSIPYKWLKRSQLFSGTSWAGEAL